MESEHRVLRLWTRPENGGPMLEHDSLEIDEGQGVVGDHAHGRMRHVTIVFADDWAEAELELGRTVDPAGRRANVLVDGGSCERLVGRTIRLGDASFEIKGVVKPCPVMDEAAPGLMDALEQGGRPGIWGRALTGGTIRIGDVLTSAAD